MASGEWINGGHQNPHHASSSAAPNVGRHYAPRHNGLGLGDQNSHMANQLGGVVRGKGANLYVSATPAELVRRGNVKRSWTISSEFRAFLRPTSLSWLLNARSGLLRRRGFYKCLNSEV